MALQHQWKLQTQQAVSCLPKGQENFVDRDSKAYLDIAKNDSYPGTVIEKLECVGYIQKCVGNRLRNLRNTIKTPAVDRKTPTGGVTLLIKSFKLQNYYRLALPQTTAY